MTDQAALLSYWRDEHSLFAEFSSITSTSTSRQYICFDADIGGFNNIRMQFEYMVIMAAITGRTLVLPAPSPWYLINLGPIKREGDIDGVCDYGEFFDIDALKQFVNVITTAEFIRQEKDRLEIPQELSGMESIYLEPEHADERRGLREQWKNWLAGNARLMPWDPQNNLIYYPDMHSVMASPNRPDERFRDSRTPVWFDDDINKAKVLYFPSDMEFGYRQLGQVSRFVAFADLTYARYVRLLLKHGLRYVPRIFDIAQSIIDQLGMFQYSSLHLRRNDIQFIESRADPATTAANIDHLLEPGEPLYLSTDETDESFFADLGKQRKIFRFADLVSLPGITTDPLESTPHKLIGCVEQLICAGGRIFAGTPHSSFSTYISRIRGYINAPDLAEHSHTQLAEVKSRGFGFVEKSFLGGDYLREDPVLWEDADLEQPIYSVTCTDASDYVHWQCELLEYSWKQVGQTGELIRLVSREDDHPLPKHLYTKVISTRFTNNHPETDDRYIPYNRLYSFQQWLNTGEQDGTVLILDPDCVFRKRVTVRVRPGAPIAQRWRGFGGGGGWLETIEKISNIDVELLQDVTWPALVHTDDMRRLMPRWIELTSLIRQQINAWESDMLAFVVAAAELGLRFTEQHLAAVMNWPEGEDEEAPIIHYCQTVEAKDGSQLWFKQGYSPWQKTGADPALARLPYCSDLIAILNEYVETQNIDRGNVAEKDSHVVPISPSPEILVRAFLSHGQVLEFNCQRGDETMQTLFLALNENTVSGKLNDRMIAIPANGESANMSYFQASSLIGLETIPVRSS
jgi:hypothetical protein